MATETYLNFAARGNAPDKKPGKGFFFAPEKSDKTKREEKVAGRYEGRGNRCPECFMTKPLNGECC